MEATTSNNDEIMITAPPSKKENDCGGEYKVRSSGSTLNPNAMSWEPIRNRASEEDRCLFLTFSNGHPLCKRQIAKFFTEKFGPCVEKVYIPRQEPSYKPPLFAKVIFTTATMPVMVLGSETQVKFTVDKKTLWCKRFRARHSTVNQWQGRLG